MLQGNYIIKVIYLPDPQFQDLAATGTGEIVSSLLEPGVDPIAEAHRRGNILCIVRMGNIDLEAPETPAMDAPSAYQPKPIMPPMPPKGMMPGAPGGRPMPYGMMGPNGNMMMPGGQGMGPAGQMMMPPGSDDGAERSDHDASGQPDDGTERPDDDASGRADDDASWRRQGRHAKWRHAAVRAGSADHDFGNATRERHDRSCHGAGPSTGAVHDATG